MLSHVLRTIKWASSLTLDPSSDRPHSHSQSSDCAKDPNTLFSSHLNLVFMWPWFQPRFLQIFGQRLKHFRKVWICRKLSGCLEGVFSLLVARGLFILPIHVCLQSTSMNLWLYSGGLELYDTNKPHSQACVRCSFEVKV